MGSCLRSGLTEEGLSRKVDLYRVLKEEFGVEYPAAWRMIHDGQIQVDGHVVSQERAKGHWSAQQLYCRMLTIPHLRLATRLTQRVP